MGPCCKNVYKQYLNSDTTIDKDEIAKIYPENTLIKTEEREVLGKKRFLFFREKSSIVKVHTVYFEGKEEKLCNCECHIKGITCFH